MTKIYCVSVKVYLRGFESSILNHGQFLVGIPSISLDIIGLAIAEVTDYEYTDALFLENLNFSRLILSENHNM